MTHGWPGSIIEFLDVIGPLSNPVAYGGSPNDAYHLVIPSLPGYGFSEKPNNTEWNIEKIAESWDTLMLRLGYSRYFAQGGDWGSMITSLIGAQNKGHCAGIHLNLVVVGPPSAEIMSNPTKEEQASLAQFHKYMTQGTGYAAIQGTRPQTLGYALADSPVGQMAWIIEKFGEWSDGSSARLYWQSFANPTLDDVNLPTACSIFPNEIVKPSKRWAEQRYKNIKYWNNLGRGGHFAAFELPSVFVDEVTAGLRKMTL